MTANAAANVLCILDGTPASDPALVAAIELADDRHLGLIVATCRPPARMQCSRSFPLSKWDALMRDVCAADLQRAAEVVASTSAQATLIVLDGCDARTIARSADARDCAAIVVIARRGRWTSWPRALRRRANAEVIAVDPRQMPDASGANQGRVPDRAFRP